MSSVSRPGLGLTVAMAAEGVVQCGDGADDLFEEPEALPVEVDGDPAAQVPCKGKGKGKGRGRGRGRAAKAKAAPKEGKSGPQAICICPNCPFPKYPGSKFCAEGDHKKAFDNMTYQHRTRKDVTEEQRAAFDEAMRSDTQAGEAVAEFARDNPPEMKRKGLVDFAKFERLRGVRASTKDAAGDVPMTERACRKYCENVLGLTEEEATEQPVYAIASG